MTGNHHNLPWVERPTIEVDFDRPLEERFDAVPADAVAAGQVLLRAVMSEVPAAARPMADLVRLRTASRFTAEAKAVAASVGTSWREIMLANIAYDLALSVYGCSTLALATPDGPVVARNMDWWPEDLLARASYAIRCVRGGDLAFMNLGWPGAIGVVTGLSAGRGRAGGGFALALNAVIGPEGVDRSGYPVLLHLRRVVEDAADFDEALAMLTSARLAAPALITLVGEANHQRVVVERSPRSHALRRPQADEPLIVTNDYRLLFKPEAHKGLEIYETTCARYDALRAMVGDGDGRSAAYDDAFLLYALTDTRVRQTITAQHAIMRPRDGEARLYVPRALME